MQYRFHKIIDGLHFFAPSTVKNKKYDVYVGNKKISFGDIRYEQYYDKIGYYKDINHSDETRRRLYRQRHANDKLNEYSPGYFSYYYLW